MKKQISFVLIIMLVLNYSLPFSALAEEIQTNPQTQTDNQTTTEQTSPSDSSTEVADDSATNEQTSEDTATVPSEQKETDASTEEEETTSTSDSDTQTPLKQTELQATAIPEGSTFHSLFPDNNLALKMARIVTGNVDATGDEEVVAADLAAITSLDLTGETGSSSTDITDVEGLEYLENLVNLNLNDNNLTTIAPLAGLDKLENLYLSTNSHLTDIGAVSTMPMLKILECSMCTELTDISPISGLQNLQELNIQVSSVEELNFSNTPKLETIYIQDDGIEDLTPLSNCPSLKNVFMKGNSSVKNLTGLNQSTSLETIDATYCRSLTEIGDLSSLDSLEMLKLSYCEKLEDLNGIHDCQNLTKLAVDNCNIKNLGTFSNLDNLIEIDLSKNAELTDISAIESLPSLLSLVAEDCAISYIGTLDNLPNLEIIKLANNKISDASEINHMPKLNYLDLSNNTLTNLGELDYLPMLQTLNLKGNSLTDISTISDLPSLTYVEASNNKIKTIGSLDELVSLKELHLDYNSLSSISVIHDLPSLIVLSATNNTISKMGTFNNMPKLEEVYLNQNSLSNISVVHDLPKLKIFKADSNRLSTFGTLDNLPELITLSLNNNSLTSIEEIGDLPKLHDLYLSTNAIKNLGQMDHLPALEILYLNNNSINSSNDQNGLSALSDLTTLKTLDIHSNSSIKDVSGLATLTNLTYLDMDHTGIKSIDSLATLPNMQTLDISYNTIKDISALSGMKKLSNLDASHNTIQNPAPLNNLLALEMADLRYNSIYDISGIAGLLDRGASVQMVNQTYSMAQQLVYQNSLTVPDIAVGKSGKTIKPSSSSTPYDTSTNLITWTKLTSTKGNCTYSYSESENNYKLNGTITVPYIQSVKISADSEITYTVNSSVTEAQFLTDIHALSPDGQTVTSDFETVVDLSQIDDYTVTLQSEKDGVPSDTKTVTVHVVKIAPVITADSAISYEKNASVTEADFLAAIHAKTDQGTAITSDFAEVVNFSKAGDYVVTLNSTNETNQKAQPVKVTVTVNTDPAPVITAKETISYDKFSDLTEADFLDDIDAATDDGSTIQSNFDLVVSLDKAGEYTVTLQARNVDDVAATPFPVKVIINQEKTAQILANTHQEYNKYQIVSEEQFLEDINARMTASPTTAVISSNYQEVVDPETPGNYEVTVNAVNEDGGQSEPIKVTVVINKIPAPVLTADDEITYAKFASISEQQFLEDVHAETDSEATLSTDFSEAVDFEKNGDYKVDIVATNEDGVKSNVEQVTVHINKAAKPVIQADTEITYNKYEHVTEEQFLEDIDAHLTQSQGDTAVTSNFKVAVNFTTAGDYAVTLNATNADQISADPYLVIVHISKEPAAVLSADNEITYGKHQVVTEKQFFEDVHLTGLEKPSSAVASSNFADVVDFDQAGDYTVTIDAVNEDGNVSQPIDVTIHVAEVPAPVITADQEIHYKKHADVDEKRFIYDVHAGIDQDVAIQTDFDAQVDMDQIGRYTVSLTAVSEDGFEAEPVEVAVYVDDATAGDVTVKYVDENGNTIAPDKTLSGNTDDSFSVVPADISGYCCNASIEGVFTEAAQTITLTYEEAAPGPITIKYVNADGLPIALDDTISGEIGDTYTVSAKEIQGYECSAIVNSKIIEEPQTIVFTYSVKSETSTGQVIVHYVDESGKALADSRTLEGTVESEYLAEAKAINGYDVVGDTEKAGTYTAETQSVTFVYTPDQTAASDSAGSDGSDETTDSNSDSKPSGATVTPSAATPPDTTSSQQASTSASTVSASQKLPATGDSSDDLAALLGGTSLTLAAAYLYRRKK
ncbi:LapB repeat-containing protein [Listeria costaricensis]|uniref:LapB repeat-containing protein n=1 Tax=Listeria costaricensis TaxID=2026604 RepID=UPI000C0722D7|nr:LapB repeat-containing protein [Listeria costaricensis]